MQVALLANSRWLDQELTLFRHLVIGLVDEQVRVVQVVPERMPQHDINAFGAVRVDYVESRWSRTTRKRVVQLEQSLADADVEVIHALDAALWDPALRMGASLGVQVVLHIWREDDLAEVPRALRWAKSAKIAFAAASEPLEQAVAEQVADEDVVEATLPGVHVRSLHERPRSADALCGVVSGGAEYDDAYEALFGAMRSIVQRFPDTQFIIDTTMGKQHDLWEHAGQFGLHGNTTLMSRHLGHHELLLEADVVIQPQVMGAVRSFALEAMSQALPILAVEDPWVDYLIENETAWLLREPDERQWETLLRRTIDESTQAVALGRRARQWVERERRVSKFVASMLHLYRRVTGEGIPFPTRQDADDQQDAPQDESL